MYFLLEKHSHSNSRISLERVNGSFQVLVSKEKWRRWNELNEVDEQVKGPIEEKKMLMP